VLQARLYTFYSYFADAEGLKELNGDHLFEKLLETDSENLMIELLRAKTEKSEEISKEIVESKFVKKEGGYEL
jgi:hypothetical protein